MVSAWKFAVREKEKESKKRERRAGVVSASFSQVLEA
jgi:hypothetical protein